MTTPLTTGAAGFLIPQPFTPGTVVTARVESALTVVISASVRFVETPFKPLIPGIRTFESGPYESNVTAP